MSEKSTEHQRKEALSGLSRVIANFENEILSWHRNVNRDQAAKEFWSAVAEHYNFKIIDRSEPQEAKLCNKCRKESV